MNQVCTLLILRRNDEVLLAMKKRGFGAGLWNGVGGKIDPGETVEQAMVRECQEEIGVTPIQFEKVAIHDFRFEDGNNDMLVHAYLGTVWEGEPVETEEMAPQWFSIDDIPYDKMWDDDQYWLPQVLAGKKLENIFVFDNDNKLVSQQITEVEELT